MSAIFNKIIAFFMSILALFGITAGGSHFVPEVKGDGWAYAIVKEEVEFSFPANVTTGCSWEYTLDNDSIVFVSEEYVADKTPRFNKPVSGSGGTQYMKFKSVKQGDATLTFKYGQQWKEDGIFETHEFLISVDADLKITVSKIS